MDDSTAYGYLRELLAGAGDRLDVDMFDGGHIFDFDPALAWFRKWL